MIRPHATAGALAALLLSLSPALAQTEDAKNREIGRTTEKEISIVLSSAFGTLTIHRGEPEKVAIISSVSDAEQGRVKVNYAIRNRVGYMDLKLGEIEENGEHHRGIRLADLGSANWTLGLSDALPLSLDIELGAGTGDFDLSGLDVKDFNLTTGASDVTIAFDRPNKSRIENMNLETGVSKFVARNLSNANFRRMKFQGGVGTYTLDFGGTLTSDVDVDVEVGLGVLNIIIPPEIGARISYEKSWVSTMDADKDFESTGENEYTTANYASAAAKMNVKIDSGLGSIHIRRQ
jgi:hypothetical protein